MQSNSHGLGLGSYSVPNSHLPPIKPGGVAGSALTSSAPHSSPDLECGGGVGESRRGCVPRTPCRRRELHPPCPTTPHWRCDGGWVGGGEEGGGGG